MYRERTSTIPGAVLWRSDRAPGDRSPASTLIMPDGCMDIIWLGGALVVAGPDTVAHVAGGQGGPTAVGLRFAPGRAPGVLGVPAHTVRNERIPLESVWSARLVGELGERLSGHARPGAELERLLAREIARLIQSPDDAAALVRMVRGRLPVADIAERTGFSERQLRRRSHDAFGYGLATLSRVLRFQDALPRIRSGIPLADVAASCGYADQAHLSREVKGFAGVSPRELAPRGARPVPAPR